MIVDCLLLIGNPPTIVFFSSVFKSTIDNHQSTIQ